MKELALIIEDDDDLAEIFTGVDQASNLDLIVAGRAVLQGLPHAAA